MKKDIKIRWQANDEEHEEMVISLEIQQVAMGHPLF